MMTFYLTTPWIIQRVRDILGDAPADKPWLEYAFAAFIVTAMIVALLWLLRRFLGK